MNSLKNKIKNLVQYRSPAGIFIIIGLSAFAIETLIMAGLLIISPGTPAAYAFLDALILVALLSPVLYFFLLKPLLALVSERDKAIEELEESSHRAQRYLDIAGAIIVVLDKEGRIVRINRRGCKTLGYPEEEIVGKDWFENFIPPRIMSEVRRIFLKLVSGDAEAEGYFENPVYTKHREERVILWHNSILREGGRVTGMISSGEDITERKRTEKALKESEIKYRLLHNTAFDAIIIANEHERIVEYNPSAESMFGYEAGAMIGIQVTSIMPEEYRERHTKRVREFLETGVSTAMGKVLEMEGLRKKGEAFPIEIVLNTFILAGERYFTAMIRDITERKRAEREKELIQARLSQSQKMEAIGRFAGGIAHDFNNILSAIRGNAELALEDMDKEDPLYRRLDGIILSVLLASKLTRQLLLFSRSQPFELGPLYINKTIEDILVLVTRLLGEGITVSTDLEPEPWMIEADEGSIEQVLMNLALNARDAMPEGGTLSIMTRNAVVTEEQCMGIPEAHPGNVVCLTVEDNGVGMEKEVLQRIFEPFFTTKELGKGTGFGLSVVYGIVKQHGGWITVKSEPGAGTTFNICIPARMEKKAVAAATVEKKEGRGESILLVDGEDDQREFARVGLSEHGYGVSEARNAQEALRVFNARKGAFHLLVCDALLPDKSGLELAERLQGEKPEIGVLITSGIVDERMKPEAVGKGFRYLKKPFSIALLLDTIKGIIDLKGTKR